MKKYIKLKLLLLLMFTLFLPISSVMAASQKMPSQGNAFKDPERGALEGGGIQSQLNSFGKRSFGSSAQTDPNIVVSKIINAGLGLLGMMLVIYMVYGGMMWMTSNGEASKVDKAKGILRQAIIGIIIVVAAYAIASFVVNALVDSTTK